MAETSARLLGKQLQVQRIIERSLENFKKLGRSNLTPAKIRSRTASLKETWIHYINGHADLLKVTTEATQQSIVYFQENQFEATQEVYQLALDFMAESLEELEPPVSFNQSIDATINHANASAFSLSHLPPMNLPPFDGSFEKWEHFRDRFTALIIKNADLRNFTRMHYLVSSLTGRALECVKDLDVTSDNFEVAWKALTSRYENKRRLLNVHLSALLHLSSLQRESASDLQSLIDKVNFTLASLKNLKRTSEELWHDMLVHLISNKLDSATRKSWNLKTCEFDGPPSFDDLTQFISSRARALEDFAHSSIGKLSQKATGSSIVHKVNASTSSTSVIAQMHSSSSKLPLPCPVCKASHYLNNCPIFVRSSPTQRRDLAKQHNRCFNCLSSGHGVRECRSNYSCRSCQKRHHSMLHASSSCDSVHASSSSVKSRENSPQTSSKPEVHALLAASVNPCSVVNVLLATAWISIGSQNGRTVKVRALLDQGSEMTFISENIAQMLRVKRFRFPVSVSAVGGIHAGTFQYASQISITPVHSLSPTLTTSALIMKRLTSYAPKQNVDLLSYEHLRNLTWADSNPASSDPIEVIIGADLFNEIVIDGLRKGKMGEPIAQNSIFGWFISGPINSCRATLGSTAALPSVKVSVHHCAHISSLDEELKRFWEIEDTPRKSIISPDDEKCERHFQTTHTRSADGRYIVRLPFKEGPPIAIGDSKFKANKLLDYLINRLKQKPDQYAEYQNFLGEYERLGHMRKAPTLASSREQYVFIPHHPVVRDESLTSKLRVVFNASSVTSNGTSLNDHLLSGAKLQTELSSVILRWRNFKFVYSADIAKMYRQIKIDSRDTNFQRIVWKSTTQEPSTEYQLLTVTYGMACAPFLALRVMRQLTTDEGKDFPDVVSILKHNVYVDDVLFGGDDVGALIKTRDRLIALLRRGGFELRKWASNSSRLLSTIDSSNHGLACSKDLSVDDKIKILGIRWNPALDTFQFKASLDDRVPNSKRSILSTIARLYDPLGWVTPVTITAKIIIQQLWKHQLTWDETVPTSILDRWTQIYSRLASLDKLQIPRWTGFAETIKSAELHGFADASTTAYAAAVYLKVISKSGDVKITLLMGKSKVAPLKQISIPRLELLAAVLLSKLVEFVKTSFEFQSLSCVCWTDSSVVLAWLRQHPSRWKQFVANRVAEIQARLPYVRWNHVPSADNPADCASRGLLGDELHNNSLWWQGPTWLALSNNNWPKNTSILSPQSHPEQRISTQHANKNSDTLNLATRYSSWPKLIRVTAYIFKFFRSCKSAREETQKDNSEGLALSTAEFNKSKAFWIKRIQADAFPNEILALTLKREISNKSSILSLRPFLDDEGILRVGGRIRKAPLPYEVRHPVLLASHPLVTLIIAHTHLRALHSGLQLTLNTVRRDYWIIHARSLVKKEIHNCVVCTRERAVSATQMMGDLPAVRVSAPTRSFMHCGVDYAGPVQVRSSAGRGIKSRKAYIALFVCLATRAIHLELVSDYSTHAFQGAFTRFCSRRGLPRAVYSDNGTTFVGADRELATAYHHALRDPNFLNQTASENVQWNFIPPAAPHFGGMWEAGVRCMKHHLRRVLGTNTLTFEELSTLLCRVEACLNSRPIAPLSDSFDDYTVLTPGHFLIGSAITVYPEPSLLELNENRLSRWQLVRHLTERLWKLWYDEYVNTLQQRSKWQKKENSIQCGQLVLIKNSTLPPCKWEIGRVTQCHPGSDGLIRVVTVKTASSEYRRPIVKLCILPVQSATKDL